MNLNASAAAPSHPAPETPLRPLSGLAVLSLILAISGIVVSFFWWWVEIVPFVIGLVALFCVSRNVRRGHMLALIAVIIAVTVGSCSYRANALGKQHMREMSTSLLTALDAGVDNPKDDEQRDAAMRPWFRSTSLERGVLEDVIERFGHVHSAYGAFQREVHVGGFFDSVVARTDQPLGIVEIGTGNPAPAWVRGTAWWVPASFERGSVFVAIQLFEGKPEAQDLFAFVREGKMRPGERAPIVADLRFYRAEKATD